MRSGKTTTKKGSKILANTKKIQIILKNRIGIFYIGFLVPFVITFIIHKEWYLMAKTHVDLIKAFFVVLERFMAISIGINKSQNLLKGNIKFAIFFQFLITKTQEVVLFCSKYFISNLSFAHF